MDIKEFVESSLKEITEGANSASDEHFKFNLDSSTSKGVHFNLAVINSEKEENKSGGKGGLSIKIVSADYGKGRLHYASTETVSRIEFNITHQDLVTEQENAQLAKTFSRRDLLTNS